MFYLNFWGKINYPKNNCISVLGTMNQNPRRYTCFKWLRVDEELELIVHFSGCEAIATN